MTSNDDQPSFPDRRQHSSNKVITLATEMKFDAQDKTHSRKGRKKKTPKGAYDTKVHVTDSKSLASEFKTDMEKGLRSEQVDRLLKIHGYNELTPPKTLHWFLKLLLSIFGGFFNQLLWGGSLLCFIAYGVDSEQVGNLYLGVVLAVVVTLTGIFGYYQEAKSDDIMEGFKNLAPDDVLTYRDGKPHTIEPKLLVPGDIIEIKSGIKLPADVRVIQASGDMEVDNSSLTGESEPIKRKSAPEQDPLLLPQEAKNLCFFGTMLLKGTGKGMVYKTGDKTFMGSIAAMAADTGNVETPIAREIKDFVKKVSGIAFALGISFFAIGMSANNDLIRNVVFLIGIIVANVPEGLLATVTVSLTLTARRMAVKKVRVKNLESVETLGSTSVICSDKTGTLTTSIMTTRHVMFDLNEVVCDHTNPENATAGDFYTADKKTKRIFPKVITLWYFM